MIVLTGLPPKHDGFGHAMWLDFALRLAYPGVQVAGIYFFEDHTPGPGSNMVIKDDKWIWDGTGYPPLNREIPTSRTAVIQYGTGLLDKVPDWMLKPGESVTPLQASMMEGRSVPERAANRYLYFPSCCNFLHEQTQN
jgi:hypothetical protein